MVGVVVVPEPLAVQPLALIDHDHQVGRERTHQPSFAVVELHIMAHQGQHVVAGWNRIILRPMLGDRRSIFIDRRVDVDGCG
ncbi:hypothetical protein D3C76_1376410 [compost metagenome]